MMGHHLLTNSNLHSSSKMIVYTYCHIHYSPLLKYTVFTFGFICCSDCLTSSSSLDTDIELKKKEVIVTCSIECSNCCLPVLREECTAQWCGKGQTVTVEFKITNCTT